MHHAYTRLFFKDIIIHSKALKVNKEHLKAVLEELHANKIFINKRGKNFFTRNTLFMSYYVQRWYPYGSKKFGSNQWLA